MQRGLWQEEAAAQNAGSNAENGEPADGDPCGHKVKFSLTHIKFVQFFFFLKVRDKSPKLFSSLAGSHCTDSRGRFLTRFY